MLAATPQVPAAADSDERPRSPRTRPWSSLGVTPKLSPSPAFLEPSKISKDDSFLLVTPSTPKRESSHAHGLSLQMPAKDTANLITNNLPSNLLNSLSPKTDPTSPYGSPTSALPRRSRGMDYSRACTNLHYSTLAEQSSPDSSPVVGVRPVKMPGRKQNPNSNNGNVPDSPGSGAASLWSTVGNGGEKHAIASSVGSVNMLDSDNISSSSEDEDAIMGQVDDEDTIHGTPQASNLGRNPFLYRSTSSPSRDGQGPFSPSAASLMSFRHARLRHHRSRKSSSSVSGRSSLTSPAPGSPPLLKSVESASNPSHYSRTIEQSALDSRRQSLSLGTNELRISDMLGVDDTESPHSPCDALGLPLPNSFDERRNVIRKAVTRGRGNLLVGTPSCLMQYSC